MAYPTRRWQHSVRGRSTVTGPRQTSYYRKTQFGVYHGYRWGNWVRHRLSFKIGYRAMVRALRSLTLRSRI